MATTSRSGSRTWALRKSRLLRATLAESLLRKNYRLDTPGLFGSCDCAERGPSLSHPDRVFPVLPQLPATSLLGSQFTDAALHRTAVRGQSRRHPASRRLTPSVHAVCRVTAEPSSQFDLPSTQAVCAAVPKLQSQRLLAPLRQSFSALCVLFVYACWSPAFPSDEFFSKDRWHDADWLRWGGVGHPKRMGPRWPRGKEQ